MRYQRMLCINNNFKNPTSTPLDVAVDSWDITGMVVANLGPKFSLLQNERTKMLIDRCKELLGNRELEYTYVENFSNQFGWEVREDRHREVGVVTAFAGTVNRKPHTMFSDPLGPADASPFSTSSSNQPPWPTTPHSPELEPSFGRRAVIPSMPTSPLPPQTLQYDPNAREPQIYGQESPGLISPAANKLSNGTKLERDDPYVRIRLTALDRNRRDILIRFDAQVRKY